MVEHIDEETFLLKSNSVETKVHRLKRLIIEQHHRTVEQLFVAQPTILQVKMGQVVVYLEHSTEEGSHVFVNRSEIVSAEVQICERLVLEHRRDKDPHHRRHVSLETVRQAKLLQGTLLIDEE